MRGELITKLPIKPFEKFSHYELWFGLWLTPYDKESSGNYCAFSSILRDIRNIRLLGINLVGGRVFHKSPKIQPTLLLHPVGDRDRFKAGE